MPVSESKDIESSFKRPLVCTAILKIESIIIKLKKAHLIDKVSLSFGHMIMDTPTQAHLKVSDEDDVRYKC